MEDMKPVNGDKDDFESRDNSKVKVFVVFSDYQNSDGRKKSMV